MAIVARPPLVPQHAEISTRVPTELIVRPDSPFRPPNWRWERARWLMDERRRIRAGTEDDYVLTACRYYRQCQRLSPIALQERYPALNEAYWIYRSGSPQRWIVEARLLTRESMERVSQRCRVSSETLTWYEKLFYCVRDSLDCPDYICHFAIRRTSAMPDARDALWKIFAYAGGPAVLDAIITEIPTSESQAFLARDVKASVLRCAAMAARSSEMSVSQQTMLDLYAKLKEIEKSARAEGSDELVRWHVEAALAAMGQALDLEPGPAAVDARSGKEYDSGGAELRDREVLMLASGGKQVVEGKLAEWQRRRTEVVDAEAESRG